MGREAYSGLSERQRLRVQEILAELAPNRSQQARYQGDDKIWVWGMRKAGDSPLAGWSIYRSPTTINPPTTLRLHYRDANGRLMQVVSITENGVTRVPDDT